MALGYAMTVGDVTDYYAASGPMAQVLARVSPGRRVQATDWPETLGGGGGKDLADADRPQAYEEQARRLLEEAMPHCLLEDVPVRYPGFHATIERDVVLEVDNKGSQRASFREGRRALEFLEQYDAPYRVKYSGNCSSHIVVPAAAFRPLLSEERWDDLSQRFRRWVLDHCGAGVDDSFHDDRHFLRLPYSLNERTGLVSLPIRPEDYDRFEPEWAEAGNVRVEEGWFETGDLEAKREGMMRLLKEALGDEVD